MLTIKLYFKKDYVIIEHNEIIEPTDKKKLLNWIESTHKEIKLYNFKLVKAVKK